MAKSKSKDKAAPSLQPQENLELHSTLNLGTQPVESFVGSHKIYSFGVPDSIELGSQIIHAIETGVEFGDLLDRRLLALCIHHAYKGNPETL